MRTERFSSLLLPQEREDLETLIALTRCARRRNSQVAIVLAVVLISLASCFVPRVSKSQQLGSDLPASVFNEDILRRFVPERIGDSSPSWHRNIRTRAPLQGGGLAGRSTSFSESLRRDSSGDRSGRILSYRGGASNGEIGANASNARGVSGRGKEPLWGRRDRMRGDGGPPSIGSSTAQLSDMLSCSRWSEDSERDPDDSPTWRGPGSSFDTSNEAKGKNLFLDTSSDTTRSAKAPRRRKKKGGPVGAGEAGGRAQSPQPTHEPGMPSGGKKTRGVQKTDGVFAFSCNMQFRNFSAVHVKGSKTDSASAHTVRKDTGSHLDNHPSPYNPFVSPEKLKLHASSPLPKFASNLHKDWVTTYRNRSIVCADNTSRIDLHNGHATKLESPCASDAIIAAVFKNGLAWINFFLVVQRKVFVDAMLINGWIWIEFFLLIRTKMTAKRALADMVGEGLSTNYKREEYRQKKVEESKKQVFRRLEKDDFGFEYDELLENAKQTKAFLKSVKSLCKTCPGLDELKIQDTTDDHESCDMDTNLDVEEDSQIGSCIAADAEGKRARKEPASAEEKYHRQKQSVHDACLHVLCQKISGKQKLILAKRIAQEARILLERNQQTVSRMLYSIAEQLLNQAQSIARGSQRWKTHDNTKFTNERTLEKQQTTPDSRSSRSRIYAEADSRNSSSSKDSSVASPKTSKNPRGLSFWSKRIPARKLVDLQEPIEKFMDYRTKATHLLKQEKQGPLRRNPYGNSKTSTKSNKPKARPNMESLAAKAKMFEKQAGDLIRFLLKSAHTVNSADILEEVDERQVDERRVVIKGLSNHPPVATIRKELSVYGTVAHVRVLYVARPAEMKRIQKPAEIKGLHKNVEENDIKDSALPQLVEDWLGLRADEMIVLAIFQYRSSAMSMTAFDKGAFAGGFAEIYEGVDSLVRKLPKNLLDLWKEPSRKTKGPESQYSHDSVQLNITREKEAKRKAEGELVFKIMASKSIQPMNASEASPPCSEAAEFDKTDAEMKRCRFSKPDLHSLLQKSDLSQYEEKFVQQGYDDVEFLLTSDAREWDEMVKHVNMKPGHAAKLLREVRALKPLP